MGVVCAAFAYAVALSERTFAATAAFTGMAMFALISDIAARSGSSSPASSLSSSGVTFRYSSAMPNLLAVGLCDGGRLLGVRVRDRVVARHVQRGGQVHRCGDVGVDQRH